MLTISFSSENKRGQVGENLFMEYLDVYGYEYTDVRLDRMYQKIDVDFIVQDKLFEIKTDYLINSTGNVALELQLDREGEIFPGWWNLIQADYLVVIDPTDFIMYRIDVQGLKNLVYSRCFRTTFSNFRDGNRITRGLLLLVPLRVLREEGLVREIEL